MTNVYYANADGSLLVQAVYAADGKAPEGLTALEGNTTDAAKEKHVPVVEREGNTVTVTVGSVAHPMQDAHYITFIGLRQGKREQRVYLNPGEAPRAVFQVEDGPLTVYEYCNLHGLWKTEA